MLSILIPTYNVNIHPLVSELQQQLKENQVEYEIIIEDDNSTDKTILHHNSLLGEGERTTYIKHPENLGRSKTRNRLADAAKFPYLLFLDCDARMKRADFIANYLEFIKKRQLGTEPFAVSGGLAYRDISPAKNQMLRYKYGLKREVRPAAIRNRHPHSNFTPFNLLISKSVFDTCHFDDSLTDYGYEDTFFGMALEENGIPVYHIDNEMFHDGLDDNKDFLAKVTDSIRNLDKLYCDGKANNAFENQSRLLQTWKKLSAKSYAPLLFAMLRMVKRPLTHLILRNNSLTALDLYKILLFDELRRGKKN